MTTDLISLRPPTPTTSPEGDVHVDDSHLNISEAAHRLRRLSREERVSYAYRLKMQGVPNRAIAATFGVTQKTIASWFIEYTSKYQETLEEQTRVSIVVESLSWYEDIERMLLFEANKSRALQDLVPEEDALLDLRPNSLDPDERRQYIMAAVAVRKQRLGLMQEVGILPNKAPETLYKPLSDEKVQVTEAIGDQRTPEEIQADIQKLLATGRTL